MSIASRINEMTEHLRNDWNSINKLGLKAKKLPDEYKQVEYIESSGTQYIDTGFAPNQNTRTIIDFMPTFSSGSLFIFGSRLGWANNAYDLYAFSSKFRDDYANTNYGNATSESFPKSANKRYLFDKNKNHSIMYEENVQFYDHTFTEKTINLSFNMLLFGLNDNGTPSLSMAKMKLYSCKIYDDDTPIRDFVPCYRINDEEVGLYDTINDVFYTNQGTGVFTYGEVQEEIPNKNIKNIAPVLDRFYNQASDKTDLAKNGVVGRTSQNPTIPTDYTRVDYIESSGTQYIDTGVNADSNLRVVLDIQYTDLSNDNNTNYGAIRSGDPNIRYHLMSQGVKFRIYTMNTGIDLLNSDTNRHTFDLDVPNNIITVDSTQVEKISTAFDAQLNFWLFGRNSDNNSYKFYNSSKLYSCQMYYNNELVRDFIPCYRNSDNKIGLYDLVNDVFYTNQGTGVFTYGTAVTDPTPENPVEINNLSGDVEYKVSGKNKLPFPYTETSHTKNGITYTINDDGTVLVNGTATAQSDTKLYGNYQEANNKEPIGKYLYGGTNEVRIRALNHTGNSYTVLATDTGNGTEIDTSVYKKYYIEISVLQGVTVNNVLIKPMVLDSLDDLKYEPYISESFPLSLKSRNLFDKDNANVISAYISGSKIISSATVDKLIYIPCKPNTTYSLQKMSQETANYNRFRIGTTTDMPALRMTVEDYFNAGDGSTLTNKTITTGANANYLVFYCYREDTLTSFEDMLSSIQIEEGSTATTYEPYYDIELCNISDYKDRIYSQNGKFYLEKKNGKVVFNGSENWVAGQYGTNSYNIKIANMKLSENNVTNPTYLMANLFKGVSYDDRTTGSNIAYSETTSLYIRNTNYTSLASFKAMLETKNLIVYYVLTTSTTTEITQENYPTLYSQLLAIQEFLTKYKINKEFLLDYSSPEIEY